LGENDWLEIAANMSRLYDNECHTISRSYCYLNQPEKDELQRKLDALVDAHLLKDSVSCARDIFGYSPEIDYPEIHDGSMITNDQTKWNYYVFMPNATGVYSFDLRPTNIYLTLYTVYDHANCNGRTEVFTKPDPVNCCVYLDDRMFTDFYIYIEEITPVYIGANFYGDVFVTIIHVDTVTL
jgi:hypothetical protein